jgi:DNA-binding MarR family transcriptional regulator
MSDWTPFNELDAVIHQPTRLMVLTILASVAEADFTYLLKETGATKGNLSSHLTKLESAGLIEIEKTYRGKVPLTLCRLTGRGRRKLDDYQKVLDRVATQLQDVTRRRSRA